jgi:hypothetical protein
MASRSTGGCPVENKPLTFLSASAARTNPPFVPKLIYQSLYIKACISKLVYQSLYPKAVIQKLARKRERFERPRFRTDRKPVTGCDDRANCGRDRGSIRAVQSPKRGGQAVRFADATIARRPISVTKTFVNTVNCGI